ncbi:uncharacterized protein LOC128199619 [Bicyclus anynana]|uniref:Uncharacterized protein LOC128199619 n=1 Tax=Bicyclus anynana TaxID=110368 RepID=A0ABM3M2V1_BICAN|nr:uncharacterized protein LOC128199619 [Bicyclus anynana]
MERRFQCTECEMNFFTSGGLKSHMLKHTGIKDFQCDVCLKWFTRKSVLREHMRIHANDRRFTCVHCGRGFVQKCSWRGHMRTFGNRQLTIKSEITDDDKKRHINDRVKKNTRVSKKCKTTTVQIPDTKITILKGLSENIKNPAPTNDEKTKHYNNFEVVLSCSTATPIRSHDGHAYTCCFCTEKYTNPADLKTHTQSKHNNCHDRRAFMKKRKLNAYLLKLDITQLKCTLCDETIDKLERLFDHLQNEHKKIIYTDIKNQIIPFKFGGEDLQCAVCPLVFNKYKMLLEHMHTHYRNYVCDICDNGFINSRAMLNHKGSHKTGSFECSHCNKIFITQQRRSTHINTVHKYMNFPNKCSICKERFRSTQMKDQHMTTMHGMTPVIRKCTACDETFTSQNSLRIHKKRFHLMERHHQCTECEMNFFTGAQLKYHMLKHTGKKDFQCDVCLKWFGRKCVLREHMRIHTNDRRFTCIQCGRGFVQKCSNHQLMVKSEITDDGKISQINDRSKKNLATRVSKKCKTTTVRNANTKTKGLSENIRKVAATNDERTKHYNNFDVVVSCSNATPIRNHDDNAYMCCFCAEKHTNPADLKTHTQLKHNNCHDRRAFMKKQQLNAYILKLDITQLKCVLCDENIETLERMFDHLQNEHKKIIYTDIKNQIIPFKFGGNHQLIIDSEIIDDDKKNHIINRVKKNLATRLSKKCKTATVENPNMTGSKGRSKIKKPARAIHEKTKHNNNFEVVLTCSTATPIRSHDGYAYACCFCTEQYTDPAALKTHTLTKHNDSHDRRTYMRKRHTSSYLLKLDITELKCTLCDENIDTLERLYDHLQNEHKKLIYTDIKNQIIPFKFGGEELQCALCPLVFNKFKILLEHMNTHYRNYVCDICDNGFINRMSLAIHKGSHKTGSFECGHCNKIFLTHQRRTTHINTVHRFRNFPNKCRICKERFRSTQLKDQHMITVHGMKPVIRKCTACDETFTSQSALRIHTHKDHLMERDFQCTECDMKFYARAQLTNHMLKHTGKKDFQCDVCFKWFGRKTVLREHMRIHANDRRFTCQQCGRGFVQKCSEQISIFTGDKADEILHNIQESGFYKSKNTRSTRKKAAKKDLNVIRVQEVEKHRHNLLEIMVNSNATPIRHCRDQGYTCCFCPEQYPIAADLKMHTIQEHDEEALKKVIQEMRIYTVKLDITSLQCAVCQSDVSTIEELMEHLIKMHNRQIYTDIKNHMIPFKFNGDELQCAMCPTKCSTFRNLTEHMNNHYRNYECNVCGAGFVNRDLLRSHKRIHKTGSFACDFCPKIFDTLVRKQAHTNSLHRKSSKKHICRYCNEQFVDYHKKKEHLFIMHGVKLVERKCEVCDKGFMKQTALRNHIRKFHFMEKEVKCSRRHKTIEIYIGGSTKTPKRERSKTQKPELMLKKGGELQKHRFNMREILLNTNATPIRCRGGVGYACCFCTDQYPDPADLKKHTIEFHDEKAKLNFMNGKDMYKFHVKLDITSLKCNICNTDIKTFEQIIDHLKDVHNKELFTDIQHQVLPFKFESERLQCFICMNVYHKFKSLLEHMNVHYRNYICAVCDAGFVSRVILAQHAESHKLGTFNCDYCTKTFDTFRKKRSHEKCIHTHSATLNKCGYCNEKFKDYRKKEKHLSEVHGIISQMLKCQACDKTFNNQKEYTVHVRRLHLMDKRFKCTDCDMSFFSSAELNSHSVKHTGVRKFECEVCHKAYGRLKTLREHMRIHMDDRRFKCEHCGQAFVQKCSKTVAHSEHQSVRIKVEEMKKRTKIKLVPVKKPSDYQMDVKKHRDNVKTILKNSNATAIQGHTDSGYTCCFCEQTFFNPAELKTHNLETHTPAFDSINIELLVPKVISMLCVKLDITELICTICNTKMNTIEALIEHLQKAHEKHFHKDITHQILPFKFDAEDLQCYICRNTFNKFKTLMEHMNVHYRNFICDVCDAGFINQRKLYHHKVAHNTGTFACSQCAKTFPTYSRQRAHERQYHELGMLVNKCRLCNALFKNNRQKDRHLEKEHGVSSFARKCHACGKMFVHQNALNIHMKRHHLVERTHKCSECGKGFFSSTELRAHMITHTGIKKHQCGVCLKSYVRKWTLNEHMRIHMDDRRFKCELCGAPRKTTHKKSKKDSLEKTEEKDIIPKVRQGEQLEKHRTNIREIIQCSNATPIRCRGGIGYACCFCTEQFPDPADLKKHTIEQHDDNSKSIFMKGKDMYGYLVKADITDLQCKLCGTDMETLEEIMEHLKDVHNRNISTDIPNHILPFKFDTEYLRCFMCHNVFNRFKALQEHMHTHYRNYLCEVCDAGFVNRHLLLCHNEGHKIGVFACEQCKEVFDTLRKKKLHMRKVHDGLNKPHKCGYCDERFKENCHKIEHLAKVHGVVGPMIKCKACDRSFATQQTWLLHTKKYHLMQRQHKCTRCEMEFFSKRELTDHMVKHTGTRTIKIERGVTKPRVVELKIVRSKNKDIYLSETKKNQHNLRTILLNSNANPIRCKDSLGYGCAFCPDQFQAPTDLKKHFLDEHNNDRLIKVVAAKLFEHVVKLDITYLNCALCSKDIPKLDDLMAHLKNDHSKEIYVDIKNAIVPFKFDTPELRCAVCSAEYLNFKLLQEHMNSHFGNYICPVCGRGFMTERLLGTHVSRHKNGEHKCEDCGKVFGSKANLREHQKRTHLGLSKRNKCLICNERFLDYWKKVDHMVKMHGAPPVNIKCQACDRTFQNQRALSRHTKKDHLLERKHKCAECEMRFFSTSSLQRHMAKHTGLRQFRCDVCFKAYGRKNTLREHMRIHADDRRFACVHCGQAFVQKCSWRSHMRSKHGEEV